MTDIRLYHKVCKYKKKIIVKFSFVFTWFLIHENDQFVANFFIKKDYELLVFFRERILCVSRGNYSILIKKLSALSSR
ncbi:MAG TPA: hypothetical protein DIS95_04195 [Proteus vulgaris]|nr:hypothetical protein EGX81_18785 [Proteus vulgaris]KGA55878.1 hypothetical protein DR95_3225 [Proteus vulgaris]RNT22165.1 hypothetical protein B9475_017015 [Proteus mirabilis]HCN41594.1 hypothetical protein [Proteus vulgaris]